MAICAPIKSMNEHAGVHNIKSWIYKMLDRELEIEIVYVYGVGM